MNKSLSWLHINEFIKPYKRDEYSLTYIGMDGGVSGIGGTGGVGGVMGGSTTIESAVGSSGSKSSSLMGGVSGMGAEVEGGKVKEREQRGSLPAIQRGNVLENIPLEGAQVSDEKICFCPVYCVCIVYICVCIFVGMYLCGCIRVYNV